MHVLHTSRVRAANLAKNAKAWSVQFFVHAQVMIASQSAVCVSAKHRDGIVRISLHCRSSFIWSLSSSCSQIKSEPMASSSKSRRNEVAGGAECCSVAVERGESVYNCSMDDPALAWKAWKRGKSLLWDNFHIICYPTTLNDETHCKRPRRMTRLRHA